MKSQIALILIFFLFSVNIFSKSIEIVHGDFEVIVSPNSDEIKAYCVFKNISNREISVRVKLILIEATDGLDVSFCWGPICYPPMTKNELWEPNDAITLKPGEASGQNEFYLTFTPNGYEGTATVNAILFVAGSPEDSINLTFRLSSKVNNVSDISKQNINTRVFVNDVLDLNAFGFGPSSIYIYSIRGNLLHCGFYDSVIDLSFLPSGIYLLQRFQPKPKYLIINKF